MNKKSNKPLALSSFDGKLPPQENELEQAVLGAMLLEANYVDKLMIDFSPELFFNPANFYIAQSIVNLYKQNIVIDILTVTKDLKKCGKLEDVGGAYYVASLTNRVAGSGNIEYHIKILQQDCLKRKIIQVCSEGIREAYLEGGDVFDLFQKVQLQLDTSIKSVLNFEVTKVDKIHYQILSTTIDIINKGQKSGVPTGLRMIDNTTNGWQKSDLIILAGRPSMGKTAIAVSMVLHPAINLKIPVGIFSLEMSKEQLVSRIQSNLSGVNVSKIVKKQINMEEVNIISRSCSDLDTAPIYIDDTPAISLIELKSKARRLVKEQEVQLIIVDYLQLMRSGMNITDRQQEIAEISRGLKALAKELNIPIIALSQLSRAVESRTDKKPMLSDLRESGQIEQDADMVMFCYRPEYYGMESYDVGNESFSAQGLFMLLIAKHRNGELGEIPLKFLNELAKVTDYSWGNNYESSQLNRTFVQQNDVKPLETSNYNDFSDEDNDTPF